MLLMRQNKIKKKLKTLPKAANCFERTCVYLHFIYNQIIYNFDYN